VSGGWCVWAVAGGCRLESMCVLHCGVMCVVSERGVRWRGRDAAWRGVYCVYMRGWVGSVHARARRSRELVTRDAHLMGCAAWEQRAIAFGSGRVGRPWCRRCHIGRACGACGGCAHRYVCALRRGAACIDIRAGLMVWLVLCVWLAGMFGLGGECGVGGVRGADCLAAAWSGGHVVVRANAR
jgi:hypothetical protein